MEDLKGRVMVTPFHRYSCSPTNRQGKYRPEQVKIGVGCSEFLLYAKNNPKKIGCQHLTDTWVLVQFEEYFTRRREEAKECLIALRPFAPFA